MRIKLILFLIILTHNQYKSRINDKQTINDMDKIVKDLNFEQIVTINNAICKCRDTIYGVISKYGIASNDIIKIFNAFAELINSVRNISDQADYNDVMNLCHNFSQHVPEEREQHYKQQLDEFNKQQ